MSLFYLAQINIDILSVSTRISECPKVNRIEAYRNLALERCSFVN